MTSQGAGSAPPAIMWDRSRLHRSPTPTQPRSSHMNGHALVNGHSGNGQTHRMGKGQPRPASGPQNHRRGQSMPESELVMSFDPMKDLHLWTMWRVAVNGRIVDETRRRSRAQHLISNHHSSSSAPAAPPNPAAWSPYSQSLVKRPLDRFIKVENGSQDIAGHMMDPHGSGAAHLETQQFVFYGVPRVVLGKKQRHQIQLP